MFDKVIWATDGSDSADKALQFARELAEHAGGELIVVHCNELTFPGKGGGRLPVHANEDELRQKIERQVSDLSGDGLRATFQAGTATVGEAARMIADAARDAGADVIVVGSHGHSALGELLIGGGAHRLLHRAPCPVLVVPATAN